MQAAGRKQSKRIRIMYQLAQLCITGQCRYNATLYHILQKKNRGVHNDEVIENLEGRNFYLCLLVI